ncbi:MAG: Fur family transcriptional regulator [Flavobacteriales bacterium]
MRKTKASTAVLKTLQASTHALSHRELQDLLQDTCDRVTIYRVLGRLTDEGLVHKVSDLDGSVRYASCHTCESHGHAHNHDHLHFTCTTCGQTRCLESVEVAFKLPEGFTLKETNLSVSGVCDRCA